MQEKLNTALVTGGSRGIGKATAQALAKEGYQVFFTYVSKADEAQKVVDTIEKEGGKAKAFCLNVADEQAVTAFFSENIKDKVNLSVLVNNAGITKDGFLVRTKLSDFDDVIAINLRGTFLCLKEAAKIMSKQRYGSIINISSVVGQEGNVGQTSYAASKAGMHGITMSAAKELASRNITVNTVAPGFIETDMTTILPQEIRDKYVENIPLRRMGEAKDIANAVAFLASAKAKYITGQILAVNGGMYC